MKTFFNHSSRIVLLALIMTVLWMVSLGVAHSFYPVEIPSSGASPAYSLSMMFLVCLINTGVLYIMIRNSKWNFLKTSLLVFTVLFGIKSFLSLVEAYFFNDALKMPVNLLLTTLLGGLLLSILYAPLAVLLTGKSESVNPVEELKPANNTMIMGILKILGLAVIVYPTLYMLAGYYIAWQFEAVRIYYTGSVLKAPFLTMLHQNFNNGIVFLCMSRGLLWVFIGLLIYSAVKMSPIQKALLIGALFALIMNSQHLIPNPYMPDEIRLAHFIETSSSNFIWGFLVAWIWSLRVEIKAKTHSPMNPVIR